MSTHYAQKNFCCIVCSLCVTVSQGYYNHEEKTMVTEKDKETQKVSRGFRVSTEDMLWMQRLVARAGKHSLGRVTVNDVLSDILKFARENGYGADWS